MFPASHACLALALLLCGCATPPHDDIDAADASPSAATAALVAPGAWHAVTLPGKKPTLYAAAHKDGRDAVAATSEQSASMWRRKVDVAAEKLGEVRFSWWATELIADATVAETERSDATARVLFAFSGDVSRLPMRTRLQFELAEALTGEKPPYATLMYVWDTRAPVGSVIVDGRTDRVRKIVLDSGPTQLGHWRDHRRDLAADFKLAFGEAPGALTAIAVMTDSDNTRSRAQAWYGPVSLH